MYAAKMRLRLRRKKAILSMGLHTYCGRHRTDACVYNSVFIADYRFRNRTYCIRYMLYEKKINFKTVARTKGAERCVGMQVVVVKAPKLLRGVLRMMFKMKKPEDNE